MRSEEQVEVNYTCPYCGSKLILLEDDDFVWFGCSKCMKFYRAKKDFITLKFTRYVEGNGYFDWRNMLKYMYEKIASVLRA